MERYRRPMYQYTPMQQRTTPSCGCEQKAEPIKECKEKKKDEYVLGMAYVPWQQWRDLYEPDCALRIGTIFKELDKPFIMGRCAAR